VLVPLFVDAGQLWTLLTRRSETVPTHKGQVAFPGGGGEVGEDAWETALRETSEELGLDPGRVVKLGELDEIEAPSGYRIVPCVGAVPHPFQPRVNEAEIAEVFSLPLLAFSDLRVIEERPVKFDDLEVMVRVYHVGRHRVWGVTARIVQSLMQRLGLEMPDGME
jgi:8-oxo-dGTP pyrophosphatase MutT (NUDIX family)